MNYMNWEELVQARDDQTPLVWSVPEVARDLEDPHHEIVTIEPNALRRLSDNPSIRLRRPDGEPSFTRASLLRVATAQDLLELGEP